ncbi:peptidoglycan editing factor PgeF [Cellulosimicrobium cellulans]|uniref:peptidoglycan editing factor PgeF n=1 Tax=Cellulosimicrobium cellulans TaxID=1710 RepID=UPI001965C573|nr:peptidoglycan editing factor PgeF [Cellulosimicrobium cellulans]MBN0041531.1 peptidoglycan editing factor PgeF [Cellulosimicrobium cellulans]
MSARPASDGRAGVLRTAPPVALEVDLGPGVRALFTTRAGGVSPEPWDSLNLGLNVTDDAARVRSNRARAAARLGAPIAFASQVHGTDVVRLDAPAQDADGAPVDSVGEADAIVAAARGVGLGVLVADCVPVLLADVDAGVVGVAHAGRRGLAHGVVPAALEAMRAAGARVGNVRAAVGPSACGRCYEVPATMRDDVALARPAARSTTSWGTPALDLPAGVVADLVAAGVADVVHLAACTVEDERFFSHRRAARGGTTTGRFAGLVALCTA